MKIAVLFRGPVRPTAKTAIENIESLLSSLENHHVITYLHSWDSEEARKVKCDVNIFEKEPENIKYLTLGNSFKQYSVMKKMIHFINSNDNYDFIIQSRTDIKIIFDDIDNWLDKNHYVTIHFKGIAPSYINDQIGVATPSIMFDAWNYKTFDILDEFTRNSKQPEDILDQIVLMNNVKLKQGKLKVWKFNEDRHI